MRLVIASALAFSLASTLCCAQTPQPSHLATPKFNTGSSVIHPNTPSPYATPSTAGQVPGGIPSAAPGQAPVPVPQPAPPPRQIPKAPPPPRG
jgi:hypothetical protein